MDAARLRLKGSDYTGVFCTATDDLIFAPRNLTKKEHDVLSSTLKGDIIEISLGESKALRAFSSPVACPRAHGLCALESNRSAAGWNL